MSFGARNQGFLQRNRDKGIPNLMLYIVLGNAVVTVMSLLNGGDALFYLLCFDKALIMQGQVWRLFTFVFTQTGDGLFGQIFVGHLFITFELFNAVDVIHKRTSFPSLILF